MHFIALMYKKLCRHIASRILELGLASCSICAVPNTRRYWSLNRGATKHYLNTHKQINNCKASLSFAYLFFAFITGS